MQDNTKAEWVRIAPGEEPPVELEESNVFPDNQPATISEVLGYVKNTIKSIETMPVNFDLSSEDMQATPVSDLLARFKKMEKEGEMALKQAEAEKPGSAYPDPEEIKREKELFDQMAKEKEEKSE